MYILWDQTFLSHFISFFKPKLVYCKETIFIHTQHLPQKREKHTASSQAIVKQALKVLWNFHRGWSYNCPFQLHTQKGGCFVIPCRSVLLWALTLTEPLPGGLKAAPQGQGMGRSLRCNCHSGSSSLRVIRGGRKLGPNSTCTLEIRVKVPSQ